MSGLVPTYRRTGSRLHAARAWVAAAYVGSLCAVAVVYEHPLMLGSALVAIAAAGFAAGVLSELARAARLAVPLALLVALDQPARVDPGTHGAGHRPGGSRPGASST